ncbi:MAG: PAS domain S-box protein [Planctomycetes bacterium]|nr:PAS domain S-box protein [Planctomycetota bacterium]
MTDPGPGGDPSAESAAEELHRLRRIVAKLEEAAAKPQATEEALRQSEERFRLLYENAPLGYQSLDEHGYLIEVNQAWLDLLGYTREEATGRWFGDFLSPSQIGLLRQRFPRFKQVGAIHGVEFEMVRKDRTRIIVSINGRIGLDEEGHFRQTHCVLHDITRRKRAERQREELLEQLEAKNTELEQFAYTVSHDLRSPLVTINGYLALLENDLNQDEVADATKQIATKHIATVTGATEKMERLLEGLLALSRIGRTAGDPTDVSLSESVDDALALVAGPIAERGVEVAVAADLPTVHGDRLRLREVMQNLVENAVKYMGDQPHPRIEIGVRSDGDEPVCFVRDNGIGIAPEYRDQVFGVFRQLDNRNDGTGIGLALVRRIIEVHGGRVWIESEGPGKGATFCFTVGGKGGQHIARKR